MYCVRKITDKISYIGASDRRIALFENVYPVPEGTSYNSYFIDDSKTAVIDTVDRAVSKQFFENIRHMLAGRSLDYVIVNHMEPDHAASLEELVLRYPEVTIICNDKTKKMINQFFEFDIDARVQIVAEGDTVCTGAHTFKFFMAPMVHWPEVMVTYEESQKILFSADAFGNFGALSGGIFDDETEVDYSEARRYYTNIVGKYGPQVQVVLKKAAALDIKMLAPLHGVIFRTNLADIIGMYDKWSRYEPEEKAVLIPYASVYGNTESVAALIAAKLADKGIRTKMYDVSAVHASYILSEAFRYSHIVFLSTTYNAGVFVNMENLLHDIANHNLQHRTVAFVENGSWGPMATKGMKAILEPCKNITYIEKNVTVKSALKEEQIADIDVLVEAIAASMAGEEAPAEEAAPEKTYVCKICGYVYKGEMPADYECPLCGVGPDMFEEQ